MKPMKKLMLMLLPALLLAACGGGHKGKDCGGKRWDPTAEQKACLKKEGCPKPESMEDKAAKEKFMKCKAKAFEACGIKKPMKEKAGDKYACHGMDGKACGMPDKYAEIDKNMEMAAAE